ncbi:MAG: glycosyltransferase family 4 protein, partial [Burkholderiales bacterium]
YHPRTQGRGAEGHHIRSIVLALRELGHEVDVLSPAGGDPFAAGRSMPVNVEAARVRGVERVGRWISRRLPNVIFELAEIGYNLVAWRKVRAALRRERYDLVYERYAFYMVGGALAAGARDVPFVLEANEVSGVPARTRQQILPRLAGWFERRLFARCASIHCVSSYLRAMIERQGVAPERIVLAPNAFDPSQISPPGDLEGLRDRLGLRSRPVDGCVGWFTYWDRLDFLIDTFAAFAPAHPDAVLLLIGDGPMTDALREQARRLGVEDRVRFTGAVPRSQVFDHIRLLDVGVLPHSNPFGSPVVMFEMMGLGIPVVAPRLAPMRDVLVEGVTGSMFEPLDADSYRVAITRLVDSADERRSMGSRARVRVLEQYTWRRNAERILASVGLEASPAQGVAAPLAARRAPSERASQP